MHISFLFTLALPLLAALARPLPGGQPESFDLDLRADPLDVDALDLRSLSPRELEDLEDLLEARAKGRGGRPPKTPPKRNSSPPKPAKPKTAPVPVAARPRAGAASKKITPSQQKARKDAVKAKVSLNQGRKAEQHAKAVERKKSNPNAKVPKLPKPPTPKGAPKTAKALRTQQAANQRQKDRKAQGKRTFGAAAAAQKATTHLPSRKKIYNVNEKVNGKVQQVKYNGADVRRAVFNSHLHKNRPVNFQPKTFENRPQGPKGNKSKPIPYMKGKGREFPLSQSPAGYKGERPGAARAIIQRTKTGHKFQGVVAHNPALGGKHPGHNDHFLVKGSKK
jgi:hypothetical protein